jgi:hypothetical protein
MAVNAPDVFVEGIDERIRLDLEMHKDLLFRRQLDKQAWHEAVGHHIAKKKHYSGLLGGGKYDDAALQESIKDININITHLQQKVKLAKDAIEHETLIVDTLTEQLKQYELDYAAFHRRIQ